MALTFNGGDVDPTGFAENMATNCNGIQNHQNNQEKLTEEEAPPTYADAFPPLPTTPNEHGQTSVPTAKWGKTETKTKPVAKPAK